MYMDYRDLLPWLYDTITTALTTYFGDYHFYHYPVDEDSAHTKFPCLEVGQLNIDGRYFCFGGELIDFVIEVGISDRFPKREIETQKTKYIETIGGFMDTFNKKKFVNPYGCTFEGSFVPSSVRMVARDINTYIVLGTSLDYVVTFKRQLQEV